VDYEGNSLQRKLKLKGGTSQKRGSSRGAKERKGSLQLTERKGTRRRTLIAGERLSLGQCRGSRETGEKKKALLKFNVASQ